MGSGINWTIHRDAKNKKIRQQVDNKKKKYLAKKVVFIL